MNKKNLIKVVVPLKKNSYPIYIGKGLIKELFSIDNDLKYSKVFVVTNLKVKNLFLKSIRSSAKKLKIELDFICIEDGENYKSWETLRFILNGLFKKKHNRDSLVLALGGGVVGDIAGFASSIFLRGINFIQVPTTLLAQVDSSVGGKTAINDKFGKNLVGSFHQPRAVFSDIETLKSLPDREFSAGLAEIIKYGLIMDKRFFLWIEKNIHNILNRKDSELIYIIKKSCENKIKIVKKDEKELGLRAILNFGHTFGHAIERGTGYGKFLHGEAVGIGMLMATKLSYLLKNISLHDYQRVIELLGKTNLPKNAPKFSFKKYIELMKRDKKVKNDRIRFVLLSKIGVAYIESDIPDEIIKKAIKIH